jgi:glutamate-5-semialdehyde dehydrogenase
LKDLPDICLKLQEEQVIIYADKDALAALKGHYPDNLLLPAGEEHYGTEFLDYKMAIKTVDTIQEAIEHIALYSSGHSEAIVCEDPEQAKLFCKRIDAACVYVNVSTAFTDGAQFGLGAEIGISTQKLHARGPMALKEITTYKYLITGNGQIRSK